jgi:SAM-dependent methyltransferase
MKTLYIKEKLAQLDIKVDDLILGDFDVLGDICAKRSRRSDDPNYKKYGAFYRSNYERGILIYQLIKKFECSSFLEIGFGRGYSTLCAAKAFHDLGIKGRVFTVDVEFDEQFIGALQQVFPKEWFSCIEFAKGPSNKILPMVNDKFDFVYIDGDHSYEGTKSDWEQTKNKCNKFILMDDYHLPEKFDPGIKCREAIDEINWLADDFNEPELIIMDRRIFKDDKEVPDDQLKYGQVLFTKQSVTNDEW